VTQKSKPHKLLSISSPNIDRFSKFFHRHILWKIWINKVVTKYTTTPKLRRYTTLIVKCKFSKITIITINTATGLFAIGW